MKSLEVLKWRLNDLTEKMMGFDGGEKKFKDEIEDEIRLEVHPKHFRQETQLQEGQLKDFENFALKRLALWRRSTQRMRKQSTLKVKL